MKTTERKECGVCGNGYREVICPKCGGKVFYFEMSSDCIAKGIIDDNGMFQAMYAVGPNMDADFSEWICRTCNTHIEVEGSFGYGWTDLTGIEKKTMEEVFHSK